MECIEYDNVKLIDFYIKNGLEFDENKGYFGINVKSYALIVEGKIIGAISISKYKGTNFIEAIAIDKEYRNKGYGKKLLGKAIELLEKPIYTISIADEFYIENGFIYDNADLIDKNCKNCEEYNINCFPKVMVYK